MWRKTTSALGYSWNSRVFFVLEVIMDLLKSRVKPMYFKYLVAASGSALVASIFGMVDAMMVTETNKILN